MRKASFETALQELYQPCRHRSVQARHVRAPLANTAPQAGRLMKNAQRQAGQWLITPPISGDNTMVIPMPAPQYAQSLYASPAVNPGP